MRIFRTSTARYQPTDNGQGVKKEISRSLPKILKKINEAIENYSRYSPIQVGPHIIPPIESRPFLNELKVFLKTLGIQTTNPSFRSGARTITLNGQNISIDVKKIDPQRENPYAGIYHITFPDFPELKIVLNYMQPAESQEVVLDRISCSLTQSMPRRLLMRQKPLVSNLEIDGLANKFGVVDARVSCDRLAA
jgi:hypothetical protein